MTIMTAALIVLGIFAGAGALTAAVLLVIDR
jgi:hypothetical protein